MANDLTPRNPLERAICKHDAKQVVRFVAEGYKLTQTEIAAEMGYGDLPPAVVMLVLELALTPKQREMIHSYWWHSRYGRNLVNIEWSVPWSDKPDGHSLYVLDAVYDESDLVRELMAAGCSRYLSGDWRVYYFP